MIAHTYTHIHTDLINKCKMKSFTIYELQIHGSLKLDMVVILF